MRAKHKFQNETTKIVKYPSIADEFLQNSELSPWALRQHNKFLLNNSILSFSWLHNQSRQSVRGDILCINIHQHSVHISNRPFLTYWRLVNSIRRSIHMSICELTGEIDRFALLKVDVLWCWCNPLVLFVIYFFVFFFHFKTNFLFHFVWCIFCTRKGYYTAHKNYVLFSFETKMNENS